MSRAVTIPGRRVETWGFLSRRRMSGKGDGEGWVRREMEEDFWCDDEFDGLDMESVAWVKCLPSYVKYGRLGIALSNLAKDWCQPPHEEMELWLPTRTRHHSFIIRSYWHLREKIEEKIESSVARVKCRTTHRESETWNRALLLRRIEVNHLIDRWSFGCQRGY